MNSNISIQDRSKKFAVRIVKIYCLLEKESSAGKILGQQLLRSGTSIGAIKSYQIVKKHNRRNLRKILSINMKLP